MSIRKIEYGVFCPTLLAFLTRYRSSGDQLMLSTGKLELPAGPGGFAGARLTSGPGVADIVGEPDAAVEKPTDRNSKVATPNARVSGFASMLPLLLSVCVAEGLGLRRNHERNGTCDVTQNVPDLGT